MNKNDKLYPHHNEGFSRVGGGSSNVSGMAMKGMGHQGYVQKLAEEEIDQHKAGAKLDQGKPDMSLLLLFGKALTAVADVGTAGAKKYTRGGWVDVEDGENRYTAAMLRHLYMDEEFDSDIRDWTDHDILHDAQVAWNALARLELKLRRLDNG